MSSNPATPLGTLVVLSHDLDPRVREGVGRNPNAPLPTLVVLLRDSSSSVRMAAERHPEVAANVHSLRAPERRPADIPLNGDDALRALLFDGGSAFAEAHKRRTFDSPCDPVALAVLAHAQHPHVLHAIATCRSAKSETLDLIAHYSSEAVLEALADNPRTSPATLAQLVRRGALGSAGLLPVLLAENRNTPVESLIALSNARNPSARRAVAMNPSTPDEILAHLASDSVVDVVKEVVANEQTRPGVLATVAQRLISVWGTSTYPESMLAMPEVATQNHGSGIASTTLLPRYPSSPGEILERLARNPRAPDTTLRAIADGRLYRQTVAGNAAAPPDLLARMLEEARPWGYDDDGYVVDDTGLVLAIIQNPRTSPSTLSRVMNTRAGRGPNEYHIALAENPATPIAILRELAGSTNPYVREAVARNVSSTDEILHKVRSQHW
ncbi:hypothetical protein ACFC1I_03205 [Microbacterium sp. NPDC056044]|uniref:hypothetical protein n=1 Tax=Microbacterium sp. NPDC056044 TaxID=3345690 RepID=UPI0035D9D446